jgi:hypothetical protein
MKRRAPIDANGGRATSNADLQIACRVVDRAEVVSTLSQLLDAEVGRHRTISVRGLLVACQLNALARHHRAHLVEAARIINALTDEQRAELGIVRHDPEETYHRVDRLFNRLCKVLDVGHIVDDVRLDAKWLANRLAGASVPKEFRTSSSVAVDGTDVETWGALHGDPVTVALDGEAAETQLMDDGTIPKPMKAARKAQVLGVGSDGRNQYTVDADARAGHRSATNSRSAGPYVGYELHLAVQARDVKWTNGIDKTSLSDEVPGVVTCFSLVPAGTHRGKAIVDDLIGAKAAGEPIDDVVWDPGYSLCKPGTVHHRLAQAGIHQTFQPVTHQRGSRPFSGDALLIDGQLLLQPPPRRAAGPASPAQRRQRDREGDLRGELQPAGPLAHDAPQPTRPRRRHPVAMPVLRLLPPLPELPPHHAPSQDRPARPGRRRMREVLHGILTAQAAEMAWWQRITYGTTAWRISMGRRQVVESVNAALKGVFTDLGRGFMRVMGVTKMTVMLGFTLAAFNLDRIRSFRAKHRLDEEGKPTEKPKQTRARRRTGIWADVIQPTEAPPG